MRSKCVHDMVIVLFGVALFMLSVPSVQSAHWEWQNPLPTGNALEAVWQSGSDIFAVGSFGTILHHDGSTWETMKSGTSEDLLGVWGSAVDNVFAVGRRGVILRFDGTSWTPMASNTTAWLNDVWGSAADDVYAVGTSGYILHYNGTTWTPTQYGTYPFSEFRGVWGSASNDVYVVGSAETILHWNGNQWIEESPGITGNFLRGVWGNGSGTVYAVGYSGTVLTYTVGAGWTGQTNTGGTSATLEDVWASNTGNVFATGYNGTILYYDGNTWVQQASNTSNILFGVNGVSGTDVTAVGSRGTILRFNGAIWSPESISVVDSDLNAIWGSASTDVFVVGESGTIIRYDGSAWSTMQSNTIETLNGVWGSAADNVFAVGANGTVARYTGGSDWTVSTPAAATLYDVWGTSGSSVFAVGASGTILHFNGTGWSAMQSNTTNNLTTVWGTSDSDIYALGTSALLHYDGNTWSEIPDMSGFYDIWGSGPNDIYMSGYGGSIVHFDGLVWRSISIMGSGSSDIWGTAADDIWMVDGSELYHFDGYVWTAAAISFSGAKRIWGSSADDVFVITSGGGIVHMTRKNFYVDIDNGSDAGDGEAPGAGAWRTLHHAVDQLNTLPPGNYRLNVAAGTYSVTSGEADTNLTITQDNVMITGEAGVVLDGENPIVNWEFGLTVDASNVVVRALALTRFADDGNPAILVGSGVNTLIEGCTLSANDRGVRIDNGATGTQIVASRLHNNFEGIYAGDASVTVLRNKIYDNDTGIDAVVYSDAIVLKIANNLFYGGAANDTGVNVDASSGYVNVELYHNTFADVWQAVDLNHAGQTSTMYAEANYNIIVNAETGLQFSDGIGGTLTGPDYNILFNCATPYVNVTPGANDSLSDPLFVDAAGFDYHLQDASPARDVLPASQNYPVSVDLDGFRRPQGDGYDLGAYEIIPLPAVLSVSPANGALGVSTGAAIAVTFSQPMHPASFDGSTFVVRNGQRSVTGTIAVAGTTATFTPDSALPDGSMISMRLTTGLQGLMANALGAGYTWFFNTRGGGAQGATFAPQSVISTDATTAFSVTAADLDDDGDLDVLSASDDDDTVEWFSNTDGNGTFGPPLTIWDSAVGARSVAAADITGDGILDVLSASWGPTNGTNPGMEVAWYENASSAQAPGNFGSQSILGIHSSPVCVVAADLDNDGDMDVLSASYGDATVAWYENTDGSGGQWAEHAISTTDSFAWDVFAADLDNDGDLDVLSASNASSDVVWYENRLNESSRDFGAETVISDLADGARVVRAADMDQDGDMDVVSASWFDGKIAWYENLGGTFGDPATNQKVIATASENTQAMHVADLDNDGDADVLYASWGTVHKIYWMENTDGSGTAWTSHDISAAVDGCQSLYVADLDNDGDLDVLSASQDDNKIAWYENRVSSTGNHPPDAPVADDPPDEAVIGEGEPLTLDTSNFSDPDGDTHTETIWEVWRADNGVMLPGYPLSVTDAEMTRHTIAETLEAGLKYGWRAGYVDADGNPSWSKAYFFKVGTSMAETLPEIGAGQAVGDFGMISIVHWPDNPSPEAVFAIDYDPANYRIGTWDPAAGHYIEFGDGLVIDPGRAYWILARRGLVVNFNGILVSRAHDIEHCLYVDARLGYGWNMIAPPNAAHYLWDYVMVGRWIDEDSPENVAPVYLFEPGAADLIDQRIWEWDDGVYKAHTAGDHFKLEMYKGYWVKALKPDVYLVFPVGSQVAGLATPRNTLLAALGKTVEWIKTALPQTSVAIAENDQPPMPPGGFENGVDPVFEGCFVGTLD